MSEVPGKLELSEPVWTILGSSILQEYSRLSCPSFFLPSFDTFEPFPSSSGIKNDPLVYFVSHQSTSDFCYSQMFAGLKVISFLSLNLLLL